MHTSVLLSSHLFDWLLALGPALQLTRPNTHSTSASPTYPTQHTPADELPSGYPHLSIHLDPTHTARPCCLAPTPLPSRLSDLDTHLLVTQRLLAELT